MTTACPRCGFESKAGTAECQRCGVVFGKLARDEALAAGPVALASSTPGESDDDHRLGKHEWTLLAAGFVAALVVQAVPFLRFVMSMFATLFHELGHAVTSWLLGHPAIPAFDFVYGGGFTHQDNFQVPLACLVGSGWLALGWLFRRNPRTLALLATVAAVWLVFVTAEWRRELAVAAMGHLGELLLAGTFFYMVLANVGWRSPEIERPLGAFVAFFVQIHCMSFAWKLGHDPDFLAWYLEGKGGALMNDLETVSLNLRIFTGFRPDVEAVAGWLLLASPLPFVAAWTLWRFRTRVRRLAFSLLTTESSS